MTDSQLRSMLEDYAQPLRYEAESVRRRHRPLRVAKRVVAAGTFISLAAYGVGVARSPEIAMRRMEHALSGVVTMTAETSVIDRKTGKKRAFLLRAYKEGRWRIEVQKGGTREQVLMVDDRNLYQYLAEKRLVTMEPLPPHDDIDFFGGSPRDYVESEINYGLIGKPRTMHLESGPGYIERIVLEREEDGYRSVTDVDVRTRLPIRSRTTFGMGDGQTIETVYRFNERIPPAQFDPKALGAPILDLVAEQRKYRERWDPPIARFEDLAIRDAAVTSDGTVFVTYSSMDGRPAPDTLRDTRGTHYLRVNDMYPGGTRGNRKAQRTARYDDGDIYTTVWVPVEPLRSPPRGVLLNVTQRSLDTAPEATPNAISVGRTLLKLRRLTGAFPEYSAAFVLEDYEASLPYALAKARAEYYRRKGDLDGEMRWRTKEFRAFLRFSPRVVRESAVNLARRARSAGRERQARTLEREFGLDKPLKTP